MGLVGKKCKIFFKDDGRVRCRIGVILEESVSYLIFRTDYGQESFPHCNVVRVEVLN